MTEQKPSCPERLEIAWSGHLRIMIIKKRRLCDTVAALKMRSLDALMRRTAQGMTIKRNAKHRAKDDNKNGGAVRN